MVGKTIKVYYVNCLNYVMNVYIQNVSRKQANLWQGKYNNNVRKSYKLVSYLNYSELSRQYSNEREQ